MGPTLSYAPPGDGTEVASFDMGTVSNEGIELWLWWEQHDDRAANAPWAVHDSTGHGGDFNIDLTSHGGQWNHIRQFQVAPGPIQVKALDTEGGWMVADAVYMEERPFTGAPASPPELIV